MSRVSVLLGPRAGSAARRGVRPMWPVLLCAVFLLLAPASLAGAATKSGRLRDTSGLAASTDRKAAAGGMSIAPVFSDDDIPGVAAPPSPLTGTLDELTDVDDVYSVYLAAGQTLSVSLNGAPGTDFDVFLYGPGTVSVNDDEDSVAGATGDTYPDTFEYSVPVSGTYYIDVWAYSGSGSYSVDYTIDSLQRVWRFANSKGYYLWSAVLSERGAINDDPKHTWHEEGVAYRLNNDTNTDQLYRFRNRRSGFYLYSAVPSELAGLRSAAGRAVWIEDGPAYKVWTTVGSGSAPTDSIEVWRFVNRQNGTYLLTGVPKEQQDILTYGKATWKLEGTGFYIAP